MATTIIPEVTKEIKYNRETKDYDCYITIDDQREYIGSAASYGDGETRCRDYAFSYYEDRNTPEKAVAVALADEAPAVRVKHIQSEDDCWTNFEAGDGLTKVLVSPREWQNAIGVFLIIGGHSINDYLDEVITLADLRQLRDNLTALLADERLAAAAGEPPTPAAPVVRAQPCICDDKNDPHYGGIAWMDYIVDTPVGSIEVAVSDQWPPELGTDTDDLGLLADWAHRIPAIMALFAHPDVKAALIRAEAGVPQKSMKKAA